MSGDTRSPPDCHSRAEALACDLPAEAVARRAPDTEAPFARARERKALSDGAIFVFPDDETARALFEFVAIERRCCAQLTYELARQPRWVCE